MPIWRVDRSRVATGHHCEAERQHQYYGGDTGFGVVPVAQSLPLATGSLAHAVVGDILSSHDVIKEQNDVNWLINKRLNAYRDHALRTGFISDDPDEEAPSKEWLVVEQSYLVAGLGLTFYKYILPDLLERFEILGVEQDIELDLGEIAPDLKLIHDTKPDFIAKRRSDGRIVSWDLKTESAIDKHYAEQVEDVGADGGSSDWCCTVG